MRTQTYATLSIPFTLMLFITPCTFGQGGDVRPIYSMKTIVFDELDWISAMAVSHDEQLLFVGGWKDGIEFIDRKHIGYIYSLKNDEILTTFLEHQGVITGACFTSDNKRIVTSGSPYTIWYWDVHSGQLIRTIPTGIQLTTYNNGVIYGLDMFQDGDRIITGDDMGNIFIWSLLTGEQLMHSNPTYTGGSLRQIKQLDLFHNEEKVLVVGASFSDIRSTEDGTYLYYIGANAILIDPHESYFLGALRDNIYRYDINTGERIETVSKITPYSYGTEKTFSPDGNLFICSCNIEKDGIKERSNPLVIQTDTGKTCGELLSKVKEKIIDPNLIKFSQSGKLLCIVKDNYINLFQMNDLSAGVDMMN